YEDVLHYLMKERRLPVNVDPADNRLANPEERARLLDVFERGLSAPRGFVLPVQQLQGRWVSERWQLRGGRMFLLPGDSPIGLRLPLDSLPWIPEKDVTPVIPADPTVRRGPLPSGPQPAAPARTPPPSAAAAQQAARDQAERARGSGRAVNVRTALAVEPRD